jgi:putative ABC transport system permease protein
MLRHRPSVSRPDGHDLSHCDGAHRGGTQCAPDIDDIGTLRFARHEVSTPEVGFVQYLVASATQVRSSGLMRSSTAVYCPAGRRKPLEFRRVKMMARDVLRGVGMRDITIAIRSLSRAKGLAITVILTLALGIGANAAIFTLVRGVLLRPLANRDEDRLIYIRQGMPGIEQPNATFSIPEIHDIQSSVHSVSQFGGFSQTAFAAVGLGEPRTVTAGVVDGTYFQVMGLRPVLGRLIGPQDDGPSAAGAIVLSYPFWSSVLHGDRTVLGKTVRLNSGERGTRTATVIGVLEPSIPYPTGAEIMVNVVTSQHHLSATMTTGRAHRMTELFGRLAPGATIEQARSELRTVYATIQGQYPEAYPKEARSSISAVRLREEVTSGARPILLVLLAASGLVFIIACSNVANLILARSVRRDSEFALRVALGASASVLRRMLLAESVLLCGVGALVGVVIAGPLVGILARYASRFSARALDLTVDSSMVWVAAGLALLAAVVLAYVPRLPSTATSQGFALAAGGLRITSGASRRLRLFAVTQIAASFVLLAGASMLLTTLMDLERSSPGFEMAQVLAVDVPSNLDGKTSEQAKTFYDEIVRRVAQLPGVDGVALGGSVPWRDDNGVPFQFAAEGYAKSSGEDSPRAGYRTVEPGFFATLHIPILEGRDFNALDDTQSDSIVIVSKSVAERMFPGQDPINHRVWWTDPIIGYIGVSPTPRRIVGVVADIDDTHVAPEPTMTIYSPGSFGRLFVHTAANPYTLVAPITRLIRGLSADQAIEHAATLADVRAEVLAPDRLNSLVFSVFAIVALAIAVVGVAGVLAFSVSARVREFGIRLAIGSPSSQLLVGIVREGATMAAAGILLGGLGGYLLARLVGRFVFDIALPGPLPIAASAAVLLVSALAASAIPAARAARIDVVQALRSD